MLLRNCSIHLSIKFCGYAFFDKIFLSLSTPWKSFKKSEDKLKQWFNKVSAHQTKLVLKWNKTNEISVYPTKRFFSKNTSNKLTVFSKYFHIKKGKWPVYFSLYCLFIFIFKKKLRMSWYIKQNKCHPHIFCNKQARNLFGQCFSQWDIFIRYLYQILDIFIRDCYQ